MAKVIEFYVRDLFPRNLTRPREMPVTNHICAIHPPLSSHPPDILEKLLKLSIGCAMGNNIQPGPIDTDLNPASRDWAVPQKAATALDRYGHVEEIAAMAAFVADPESSYITGANLTVDGGMNA